MNNILIFLGVTIAIASVASLPSITTPVISAAIQQFCSEVPTEQAEAKFYYKQLSNAVNANSNAQTYFNNTLSVINNPNEEAAFLAGSSSCTQFFTDLKAAFTLDLQKDGFSIAAIKLIILGYVETLIATVRANNG